MAPADRAPDGVTHPHIQTLTDALIEALRDRVLFLGRIEDLERELAVYRELAKQAIHELAEREHRIKTLQRQLSHVRDELRGARGVEHRRGVAA